MFSYVCTACGKKTPADTLAPVCGCGGLFELDFKSPKWDDAKIARAGLYIEHTTAANFAAWDHYCELYGPSTDVLITLCGAGIKSDH